MEPPVHRAGTRRRALARLGIEGRGETGSPEKARANGSRASLAAGGGPAVAESGEV